MLLLVRHSASYGPCLRTLPAAILTDTSLYPSTSLHGRVAHEIGREIVSGAIPEGEYLAQESELATRFSVSRQVVREALKVLGAKGLVATRRRAGTRVLPRESWNLLDADILDWHPPHAFSSKFLGDLAELRRVVEPEAAAMAAERATDEQIAEIGKALDAMRSVTPVSKEFFDADAQFHFSILKASGNSLIDQLRTIVGPSMKTAFPLHYEGVASELVVPDQVAAFVRDSIEDHAGVYDAIADRDTERAAVRMKTLLSRVSTEVEYFLRHGASGTV